MFYSDLRVLAIFGPLSMKDPNDIASLERLRTIFLQSSDQASVSTDSQGVPQYWREAKDLDLYDRYFGKKLRQKWLAVGEEIKDKWAGLKETTWVDFGAGTGRATRTFLEMFPPPTKIHLIDHSPVALEWLKNHFNSHYPNIEVSTSQTLQDAPLGCQVLVSHVINEINKTIREALLHYLEKAESFVWVEPGTSEHSRELIRSRNSVLTNLKVPFKILGPCPRGVIDCPLIRASETTHWCHSFATTDAEDHQDSDWVSTMRSLGVDIRSSAYSFIAAHLGVGRTLGSFLGPPETRVIGKPRVYKGYVKILCCDKRIGVEEFRFQKRESSKIFKEFKEDRVRMIVDAEFDGRDIFLRTKEKND